MILAYVQCDRTALYSLSLVSPDLQRLSNQILYADINWMWIWHSRQRRVQYPPINLLLRTLLERPELALFIKRLHLDVDDTINEGFKYAQDYLEGVQPEPLDLQTTSAAMSLVSKIGFPQKDRWHAALQEGSIDAVIALILSQLKGLEILNLGMPLVHNSVFVGDVLSYLIMERGEECFDRLRDVKLGENIQGFDAVGLKTNLNQIIPCFYLPSLKELDFTISEPEFDSWPLPKEGLPPTRQPQSLTTLRLYRCDIKPEHVAKFVTLAPALTVLHCGFLRDEWAFQESDQIDFADLRSALLPTADTLEELTIDVRHCEHNCDVFQPLSITGKIPMGSMQQFHALRRLKLPTALLLGDISCQLSKQLSDLLPPSLRSLSLIDETVTWESYSQRHLSDSPEHSIQPIIDALTEYLDTRTQHAPCLQDITLIHKGKLWDGRSPLDEDYVNSNLTRPTQPVQLRSIAERNGIALSVSYLRRAKVGNVMYHASMFVYDPEKPATGPVENESFGDIEI